MVVFFAAAQSFSDIMIVLYGARVSCPQSPVKHLFLFQALVLERLLSDVRESFGNCAAP